MIRQLKLADLIRDGVAELQTGPFGTMLHASAYITKGTPVIAVQHVRDGFLKPGDMPMIGESDTERLNRYKVKTNDILFCRKGAVERRALIRADEQGFIQGSDCIRLRLKDDVISPPFVSYVIGSPTVKEWLKTNANGATMPSLNQSILGELPIPLLPLPSQRRIAEILGALDDKIELNRKMNETLEAMARAIFRSWFVDFDPVRVKARGGDPVAELGLSPEIAALFPDSFQDSELGEIPEGWHTTTVEKVCSQVVRGVTPSYEDGSKRFIINQRTNRGQELSFADLKELSPGLDVPSDKLARKWDVLVNCLGEGTLGRVHLFRFNENEWAVDQHMTICRPKSPQQGMFLYCYLSSPEGQERIESSKSGSTGMTMFNISKLRDFVVLAIPDELLSAFGSQVAMLFDHQNLNTKESLTLSETRDYLLPLLLSGKIDVSSEAAP